MRWTVDRFSVLFSGLTAATALAAGVVAHAFRPGLAVGLAFFDRYVVDLCATGLVLCLLLGGKRVPRVCAYVVAAAYLAVYAAQTAAFAFGREFLSRLALDNLTHADFFLDAPHVLGAAAWVGFAAVMLWVASRRGADGPRGRWSVAAALLAVGLAAHQSGRLLPAEVLAKRDWLLASRNMPHTSPLLAFATLFKRVPQDPEDPRYTFSADDLAEIRAYGFPFKTGADYPFVKDRIYDAPPPFGDLGRPNVLVLFTEGTSAGTLAPYGTPYPGLTPNLAAFADTAMVVDDYYNHTAATNRGLKGQLCSFYPAIDGLEPGEPIAYRCLPHVAREAGYTTEFLNAHKAGGSPLDVMMGRLGFQAVLTGDEAAKRYLGGEPLNSAGALSDHQFYRALIGRLRELEAAPQPFLLATYNLETHANFDVGADGVTYGDSGTVAPLNTIHNHDHAFGAFWEYFKSSPLARNTLVVFTADHCHYPEVPYVEAFPKLGYPGLFFDRIPLLIRAPDGRLPRRFDARHATSVALAPTLAHLLGLPNGPNPFFGRSLFEPAPRPRPDTGVAVYNDVYLVVERGAVRVLGQPGTEDPRELRVLQRFLAYAAAMETHDRLWPHAPR